MPTRNEKGGILLELAIVTLLLALFLAESLALRRSLQKRCERILQHRNNSIAQARRTQTP